jgi:hypothetical protein
MNTNNLAESEISRAYEAMLAEKKSAIAEQPLEELTEKVTIQTLEKLFDKYIKATEKTKEWKDKHLEPDTNDGKFRRLKAQYLPDKLKHMDAISKLEADRKKVEADREKAYAEFMKAEAEFEKSIGS